MIRNINSAALHAGTTFRNYAADAARASRMNAEDDWIDGSPGEFNDKRDMGRAAIQSESRARGWSPERTKYELETFDNNLYAKNVAHFANDGQIQKAWEMYQDALTSGKLKDDTAEKLKQHIWSENEKRASKVQVDGIYSPDKTDADMYREVEQMSNDPKMNLGDPNYPRYMRLALDARIRSAGESMRRQKADDVTQIARVVNNGASDFASVDADPRGHAALESLKANNPAEYTKIKSRIYQMAQGRDSETNRQVQNRLQYLSQHDPKAFLEMDLFDERMKLSKPDRDHWINERERILKQGGNNIKDPIVDNAITYMQHAYSGALRGAGLIDNQGRRIKGENWESFWGYVDSQIRDFQARNQKAPKIEDLKEIANSAFINHQEPWLGQSYWPSTVGEYRREFTTKQKDEARQELIKDYPMREPDDVSILRRLRQKRWIEMHQGAGKKPEEVTGGGTPTVPTVPISR